MARKIAVVGASGNGKTMVARRLAARLDLRHVELDSLFHLPGWREASDEDFRRDVEAATDADGWVLDGDYDFMLGDLVFERADTVVWLDQPLALLSWRLVRRSIRDIVRKRELHNRNRQTWRRLLFVSRGSLLTWAIRCHFRYRRDWPRKFAGMPHLRVVRLRSSRAVERWLAEV